MKRVEFLTRYESVKEICNGNAPEICRIHNVPYFEYRRAIGGVLTNPDKLSRIWACIERFVADQIVGAIELQQVRERVKSLSQKNYSQIRAVML